MKKLFAILAVLVLFGTYAWAGPATQNVNVTVTCTNVLVVTCTSTSTPWEPTVTAGGTASTTFTWNITGNGTGNPPLDLNYTHDFTNPWDDGNGVTLAVNAPVQGDWQYEGCNDNVDVTASATINVALHATSGPHSFSFDLTATY